jgi:hypothetical protein
MMFRMRQRLFAWSVAAISLLWAPVLALAQDESKVYDARLEGYEGNLTLSGGGSGLLWLLLIVMGVLCIGVLFKSSGRTHLD